ncbi:MAG: ATP-binding cassette domain-containing protein [Betaproteobacteria bacterium]|nr:ATP-binding cassette domain-containing protein [Betaproteobacteria bacterium]
MLELLNICKQWTPPRGAPVDLLRNASVTVGAGETVALLGPSGSGKSTLLRIAAGLEHADAGTVRMEGADISRVPPERRGFALMFQDFALFPHLNVLDNVAFGLVEQHVPKAQARDRAQDMLARFGLAAYASSRVWQLSGGEQQRVALARALITRPRALLLDEPFSALDADLRLKLRQEFSDHIAEHRMATLWVTHDESEARAMATRAYRLVGRGLSQVW